VRAIARVVKRQTAELALAREKIRRHSRARGNPSASALFAGTSIRGSSRWSDLLHACCVHSSSAKFLGQNAVAREHQLESRPVGPVAQWLVQGTHRRTVPPRRKPRSGRDEFREPFRSCDQWQP
jgi:hypothetical protein